MADSGSQQKFTISSKTPEERGITFSVRESTGSAKRKTPTGLPVGHQKVLLGPWRATAICGNDITSSCLYVAAMASAYAGAYAPFALLTVAALLFLYRKIYAEVGDALPLNGGAYNCLLNTTTKARASLAACMTILSYIATAVISAKTSIEYMRHALDLPPEIAIPATIGLLAFFACLTIVGTGESANAALGIFIFHIIALGLLIVSGLIYAVLHPEVLQANWANPLPKGSGSVTMAVFFGFCIALLGVSGFESSANFIEEQQPGVFPITLRNMWIAVAVLNPLIAFVAISVLPLAGVIESKKSMLLVVADQSAGAWLKWVIAIDASIVLSGAVLAAFVGVTGLVQRMTLDRCLPQFLLKSNRRGTSHRIIIMFLLSCISILVATAGDLDTLGGVYTLSFLGVMCLFAIGNILLKLRRSKLPRKYRASWPAIFIALFLTIAGIYGNMRLQSEYIYYFSIYFFPTACLVLVTIYRQNILGFFLIVADETMKGLESSHQKMRAKIKGRMDKMYTEDIIFFTKGDDVASLNRALLYVRDNETSRKLTVVHVLNGMEEPPPRLVADLKLLDEIYPEIQVELVIKSGKFGPKIIQELSQEFGIPPNYMFVGTPGNHFPHQMSALGGVRVII
jgi:amino acid transporter